jgi:hypothetical protein
MIYWLIGYKTSYPNGADNKEEANPRVMNLLCEYNTMGFVKAIYIKFFTRIISADKLLLANQ